MCRNTILLAGVLLLAVGCGSTAGRSAERSAPAPVTTMHMESVPATTGAAADNPAGPTGTILMVKLYVGSLAAGEKFYGAVFGAKLGIMMGDTAHIVTFPHGGPGLVLLKKNPDDNTKQGSFIIQVPDLQAARALAIANGAAEQQQFTGSPAGQTARSIDLLDPWGNQIEILQIS